MNNKNCPILLAECRYNLCPYYEKEMVSYFQESWFHTRGCYETYSECANPICKSRFNIRMSTRKDFEKHGMSIYEHELYKYAEE